jgi:S1-C subfamily serine protease
MRFSDSKDPRLLRILLAFTALGWVLLLGIMVFVIGQRALDDTDYLFTKKNARGRTPASARAITARGNLAESERTTINLFEQASPSVVFITTLEVQRDVFSLDILQIPRGTGSGIVWDQQGHIVTNLHVLQNANAARVTLADGSTYRARLTGQAIDKDLAVLQIEAPKSKLRPIPVGKSSDLKVGQSVFAIGNPFGLDQTLSVGVISGLGRQVPSFAGGTITGAIQTDAAINPGNSGGPLLDSAGRLIGVNTAIFSPTGANAGVGFAIPVDTVNAAVPQLIAHGRIIRPRLGVQIAEDSLTLRLKLKGAMVLAVEEGSPAARAGLQGTRRTIDGRIALGDLIVGIDASPVDNTSDLFRLLETHAAGDVIVLQIQRDDTRLDLKVALAPGS